MDHPFVIKFPTERTKLEPVPQSEIGEIREMFQQINQRYMVYEPSAYYYTIKRVIDLVASMTFTVFVMSWLYPLVALLIKLTSKGPVLFIQKRTGYKGLDFDCFNLKQSKSSPL
jgi:putative colanic acid biosynthesis UDP-glucose lipid carrier transferase